MYHSGNNNNWDFYSSGLYRGLLSATDSFKQWLFRMSWSNGAYPQNRQPPPPINQNPANQSYRYYNRQNPYQSQPGGYRPQQGGPPPAGYQSPVPPTGNRNPYPPPQNQSRASYTYQRSTPPAPVNHSQENRKRKEKNRKRFAWIPFLSVAICIIAYILLFPLQRWYEFVILALTALCVFFATYHFFPGARKKERLESVDSPPPLKSTGDKEIDQMIQEGNRLLYQMQKANVAIENRQISKQIVQLEKVTQKIFDYVTENPKKVQQIRKFMNYYLPTTLKLLRSYDKMSSQEIEGENISTTMHDIEGMMHTIVLAFEKQLDRLFQDEALDIAAEITVLENMLAQEGLTENK